MRPAIGCFAALSLGLVLSSCGSFKTPTEPAPTSPGGFGRISVEVTGTKAVDFAMCLAGSPTPSCFTTGRAGVRGLTASPLAVPGSPSNLSASSTGSSVTLTWTAPASGDPSASYIIEAGSAPGLANLANFSTGSAATVFQAGGVAAGTYYVRVRAANGLGTSAPSNEAVLVVGGSPGVAPGAPSGLTNTLNSGGIVGFAWTAASGSPSTYIIEAGSASGLANLANSDLGGTATTMTATGVGAGTYYVRVRAKNAFGISAPSNEVVVTVGAPGCSPDLQPTSLDFVGTFVSTVPVGPSSGLTVTFVLRRLPGSDVFFEGSYSDTTGRTGSVFAGLIDQWPVHPRVSFGFVHIGLNVVTDGAIFTGDLSVCSGNRVIVFAGEVHMGYVGSRPCQPGESCLSGGIHLIGPGYPMVLTRQ